MNASVSLATLDAWAIAASDAKDALQRAAEEVEVLDERAAEELHKASDRCWQLVKAIFATINAAKAAGSTK